MSKVLGIGTVSEGTLRSEDMLSSFFDAYKLVDGVKARKWERDNVNVDMLACDDVYTYLSELVDDLQDILGEYVPDYCYFGNTEGDGADFGCGIDTRAIDDAVHDGTMVKLDDTAKYVWSCEVDHVLLVNDHGNMTMFRVDHHKKLRECWACV